MCTNLLQHGIKFHHGYFQNHFFSSLTDDVAGILHDKSCRDMHQLWGPWHSFWVPSIVLDCPSTVQLSVALTKSLQTRWWLQLQPSSPLLLPTMSEPAWWAFIFAVQTANKHFVVAINYNNQTVIRKIRMTFMHYLQHKIHFLSVVQYGKNANSCWYLAGMQCGLVATSAFGAFWQLQCNQYKTTCRHNTRLVNMMHVGLCTNMLNKQQIQTK